jgi:hypothetical protein
MNKLKLLCCLLLIVFLVLPWSDTTKASSSSSASPISNEDEFNYQYGVLEGNRLRELQKNSHSNYEDIKKINKKYFIEECKLNPELFDDIEKYVDDTLELREEQINLALAKGIEVSPDSVNELINKLRSEIMKADNNSSFLAFIKGTGMTDDEYWATQYNEIHDNLLISAYKNQIN